MVLEKGTRFGAYEIAGQIGSGGMGVVYRAMDTKLKRDVAIKVLPASLADDAERLARFRREAEVLASLNHSNIAHIHGLEESDGTTALILELVEGPTLADRIAEGALPIGEALDIAMQIAGALEAAHGQGIVHRDLKPANIKLKNDGTVKVLDFGIAKALDTRAASGLSPVMETPTVTETGIILGTAAYMSPEQARGKGVDERTDIWAFACVLYEMLTGQQAFGGEDVTVMLARILEREPDMDALPKAVSPAVRHTIEMCIQKDVRKRFADIRDVKLSLGGVLVPRTSQDAAVERTGGRRTLPVAVGAASFVGALVAVIAWALWPTPELRPVNRFAYSVPADQAFRRTRNRTLSLAPNGRHFVYNTTDGLYLRRLDELEAQLIQGTEEDLSAPFLSPDGQSIAYHSIATDELRRIPVSGGAPITIASGVDSIYGASWEADGTIFFGQSDGIYRISVDGGSPERVVDLPPDAAAISAGQLLPDGDSFLFSTAPSFGATGSDWSNAQIVVASLSTNERAVLPIAGRDPRYLPTGHLVYAVDEAVFAVTFDPDSRTVFGETVSLIQGVERGEFSGAAEFYVADDGTLLYLSADSQPQDARTIVWVDREGREEELLADNRPYQWITLSPDGRRLAMTIVNDGNEDIWIHDVIRGTVRPFTSGASRDSYQIWTPDSLRIVYQAEGGLYWQAADGTGQVERLVESADLRPLYPYSFSPEGEHFLFGQDGDSGYEIHVLPMQPRGPPELLFSEAQSQYAAVISPAGGFVAYVSQETGQEEVYVRPFPNVLDGKWQLSGAGGSVGAVVWGPDGQEILFVVNDLLMSVSIETEPTFSAGVPEPLFSMVPYQGGFSVAPEGDRFAMIKSTRDGAETERPQIVIVENWLDELERLVPTSP